MPNAPLPEQSATALPSQDVPSRCWIDCLQDTLLNASVQHVPAHMYALLWALRLEPSIWYSFLRGNCSELASASILLRRLPSGSGSNLLKRGAITAQSRWGRKHPAHQVCMLQLPTFCRCKCNRSSRTAAPVTHVLGRWSS